MHSLSTADTQAFARRLAAAQGEGAFYALRGDLGAGKTCFVQGIALGLGIRAAVASPTFAIAREYRDEAAGKRLLHLDLYRLSGADELPSVGWDDYLASGDTMCVEWPERAEDDLPPNTIFVDFAIGPAEDERTITVTLPDGSHFE